MKATEVDVYSYDEQYRDNIATVDEKGKRIWVYPKKPSGILHRMRVIVSIILLALLFSGPFITINGRPFLLLNVFESRFVIFGQPFWPQDFVLLAITLIAFFVFIILFTVIFGRIWCGWLCPQTLFMEMVFRKIEYWIEGDAPAQRRLNAQQWNFEKMIKKGSKQFLFIIISSLIAHTVMAYLIGIDNTLKIASNSPEENMAGFTGLVAFTIIFYGVYAKFREQACIAVCPYGRLQGVLLIADSIVVAYDWIRGEPRGHIRKTQSPIPPKGDCIDCKLCVHVCPTGIDIRNGTQLECINCTACIDACDDVMLKIGKPPGLIRYASYNSIKGSIKKLITPRVISYSVVLIALIATLAFTLSTRSDVKTTVFKIPGTLYQKTDDGYITNLYNIEFLNKTFDDIRIEVRVESPSHATLQKPDGEDIIVKPGGIVKNIIFLKVPQKEITSARTVVRLGIYENDNLIETVKVKFIGPVTKSTDMRSRLEDGE